MQKSGNGNFSGITYGMTTASDISGWDTSSPSSSAGAIWLSVYEAKCHWIMMYWMNNNCLTF